MGSGKQNAFIGKEIHLKEYSAINLKGKLWYDVESVVKNWSELPAEHKSERKEKKRKEKKKEKKKRKEKSMLILLLTFRHRASSIYDRHFATLQRTLFIYLINKYISLSDICLTVHH